MLPVAEIFNIKSPNGLILLKNGIKVELMVNDNVDAQIQDNFRAILIFSDLEIGVQVDSLVVVLIQFLLNVDKSPVLKVWVGVFEDIFDEGIGIVRRIGGNVPEPLVNEDLVGVGIGDSVFERNNLRKAGQKEEA